MSIFGRRQPDSSRERSAAERERARLEREARRAAREGRPPPPIPDEPVEEAAAEPARVDEPAPEPFAADEPALADEPAADPFAADEPALADEPAADFFAADEPAAESARAGEPASDPRASEADDDPFAVPAEPAGRDFSLDAPTVEFDVEADQAKPAQDPTFERWELTGQSAERATVEPPAAPPARPARFGDEHERPTPPKRVTRRTLPPPPPPPGERPRRGRGRRGRVLGILALLLIAGAAWLANTVFQPFKGDGGRAVSVRIPTDTTADEVGDILAEKGIVDSAFVFTLRARIGGAQLQAGTYQLKQDSSYAAAIDALEAGPPPPKTIRVTIPEGRSRREAAPLVEQAGLEGSYLGASETPTDDFNPRRYGAPRGVTSLEGFLFPATYELKPGATARRLVAQQLDAFRANIKEVGMGRAGARNLTTYEVLTIASMVEREAQLPKERRLIAAVIHNRLRDGMPLGIDATIRYATRNWSSPLKQSELAIDSPYNTRRRTGLPPGPIGSPGLASIKAAANPANVDYLFYVVKPGTCGEHEFSATDAEFQRDVAAYNAARERAGGKSPTTC